MNGLDVETVQSKVRLTFAVEHGLNGPVLCCCGTKPFFWPVRDASLRSMPSDFLKNMRSATQ